MKILGPAAVVVAAICCAPTATAITGEEMCQAMHWPMPLPSPVGYSLVHTESLEVGKHFLGAQCRRPSVGLVRLTVALRLRPVPGD
jgi:hypothetical protein